MGILILILLIVLIVFGGFSVYKITEVHELHKMRDIFSDMKKCAETYKAEFGKCQDLSYNDYGNGLYNGKLEEINDVIKIVDKELESLKSFDFGNSD